jgi:hypothetical protein
MANVKTYWSEADEAEFQELALRRADSVKAGELVATHLMPIIKDAEIGVLPEEFGVDYEYCMFDSNKLMFLNYKIKVRAKR